MPSVSATTPASKSSIGVAARTQFSPARGSCGAALSVTTTSTGSISAPMGAVTVNVRGDRTSSTVASTVTSTLDQTSSSSTKAASSAPV